VSLLLSSTRDVLQQSMHAPRDTTRQRHLHASLILALHLFGRQHLSFLMLTQRRRKSLTSTTAERTRIARRRTQQSRKQTWLSSSSLSSSDLTSTTTTESQDPRRPTSSRSRLRKARSAHLPPPEDDAISYAEALWFITLPDKVRRQHFSQAEQETLARKCQAALEHAVPASIDDQHPASDRTRDSLTGRDRRCSLHSSLDLEKPPPPTATHPDMRLLKWYSRRRAATTDPPSDVLDDAPAPVPAAPSPPPPTPTPSGRPRRKSYNRALSLTPIALPPPTLAPAPSLPSPVTIRNLAIADWLSRPDSDPHPLPSEVSTPPPTASEADSCPQLDVPNEMHAYHAPRRHSTQEMGFKFPFKEPTSPTTTTTTTESFPAPEQESTTTGGEEDDASVETRGPQTPVGLPEIQHLLVAHSTSEDSGTISHTDDDHDLPKAIEDRSRTPSSASSRDCCEASPPLPTEIPLPASPPPQKLRLQYNWPRKPSTFGVHPAVPSYYDLDDPDDPLALESLAVCEDATGAHGAFATAHRHHHHRDHLRRVKGFKEVWKGFRGS